MKLVNVKTMASLFAAAGIAAGACVVACSSGSSSNGGTGGDASTNGQGGACPNPTVPIIFSPTYSAFIPGSTQQTFAVPAITADGNQATWTASDSSQVNLAPQSFTVDGVSQPGVMITIAGTGNSQGQVTIYANESGGACGAAVLTITTNSENDWTIGNARYNNGNNLHLPSFDGGGHHPPDGGFPEGGFPDGGFPHHDGGGGGGGFPTSDGGSFLETDGGTACTSCHGPTATNFIFKDVQHTPEQTGGFSDQDLTNIILNGVVPDGGYFDPGVLDGILHQTCDDAGTTVGPNMATCAQRAYTAWTSFHQWTDITTDEMPGMICYLRSLAPQDQSGSSSFGGGHHHDGGGGGGGGGGSSDAGGGGPSDAGGGG
jgi:hypothetical protein